jgi:site-specific DNA recombinase
MYADKLDGRIDAAFFDRGAAEGRSRQSDVMLSIDRHQAASRNYLDEGIRLLELASRARELFEAQEPREKRRLLDFVVSNCSWKDGELSATPRQPFDLLAVAAGSPEGEGASEGGSDARFEKWLPEPDATSNSLYFAGASGSAPKAHRELLLYFAEPSGVGPVPTVRQVGDPS